MSRGCLLVYPCGCQLLNGVNIKRCAAHQSFAGILKKVPEQDEWLRRHQEKQEPTK